MPEIRDETEAVLTDSSDARTILVVSPTPTHPTNSGSRARILQLINELRNAGHEVHLAHIGREPGDDEEMRQHLGPHFHPIAYTPPEHPWARRKRRLLGLFRVSWQHNLGLDEWWDDAAEDALKALQEQFSFDTVIVEYVFFSKAFEVFPPGVRRILDTHDVFTDRFKMYLENGARPQWYSTSARQEARALQRTDLILAIQANEAEHFQRLTDRPVAVIEHLISIAPASKETPRDLDLLYIGARNPINIQSVQWFKEHVLSAIRKTLPNATLSIGGSLADHFEEGDGIHLLGFVDDLPATYARAQVVVNPMLYGTGLKIKTIEALGYGKALVTTKSGGEGLEDGAGHAFELSDDANTQAEMIIELLSNPECRTKLECGALDYAKQRNQYNLAKLTETLQR